jgi:hypothetical protein
MLFGSGASLLSGSLSNIAGYLAFAAAILLLIGAFQAALAFSRHFGRGSFITHLWDYSRFMIWVLLVPDGEDSQGWEKPLFLATLTELALVGSTVMLQSGLHGF